MKKFDKSMLLTMIRTSLILIVILLIITSIYGIMKIESEFDQQKIWIEEETYLVQEIFMRQISDITFLSDYVLEDLWHSETLDVDHLETVFYKFAESKDVYYQVRFLDADKVEKIKVIKTDQGYAMVDDLLLQDKSDYYYLDAAFTSNNDIYFSKIDLNVEFGIVEQPLQPVVRIVKPVYTSQELYGYIILNYDLNRLLSRFESSQTVSQDSIFFANEDQYWISGPDDTNNWGFMLSYLPKATIADYDESLSEAIAQEKIGNVMGAKGIYSFSPYQGNYEILNQELNKIQEEEWYIIVYSSYGEILFKGLRTIGLFGISMILLLSILMYQYKDRERYRLKEDAIKKDIEEKLKTVTESVADAIVMINNRGNVQFWNKAAQRMFYYEAEEVIDHNIHNLIASDEFRKPAFKGMEGFKYTGKGLFVGNNREVIAKRKDGSKFVADLNINAVEVNGEWWAVGVIRDITLQKERLIQLQRLSSAVENAADAIVILDAKGNVVYVNTAFVELTGYGEEEIKFQGLEIIRKDNEDLKSIYKMLEEANKEGIIRTNEKNTKKNGENFYVSSSIISVKNDDDVLSYIYAAKDVTKEMLATEQLEKNIATMEQVVEERTESYRLAKMEAESANMAKSAFLAHMSHEIRTPLNAIIGFSQILGKDPLLNEHQIDQVNTIYQSGEHLLSLINDILELSKIESGRTVFDFEPVDFGFILDEIERMFTLKIQQQGISMDIERLGDFEKAIVLDKKKIRQILLNIVGNAVKFTKEGGVAILAEIKTDDAEGGLLKVSVKDTAHGIEEEDIQKIFNPFEQASLIKHKEEGTGLGLSITKRFIEGMGGNIKVRSVVGQGSEFYFEIPVTFADLSESQNTLINTAINIRVKEAIDVLVVDDKVSNVNLIKELLTRDNIRVISAFNGKEAIEKIREFNPDIVFMDLMMPEMNGFEAVAYMRKDLNLSTPVCAVTASLFDQSSDHIISKGFDYVIRKPFKNEELYSVLIDALPSVVIKEEEVASQPKILIVDYKDTGLDIEALSALEEVVLLGDLEAMKDLFKTMESVTQPVRDLLIGLANEFDIDGLLVEIEKLKSHLA